LGVIYLILNDLHFVFLISQTHVHRGRCKYCHWVYSWVGTILFTHARCIILFVDQSQYYNANFFSPSSHPIGGGEFVCVLHTQRERDRPLINIYCVCIRTGAHIFIGWNLLFLSLSVFFSLWEKTQEGKNMLILNIYIYIISIHIFY
jgi:hypothetical protein